MSDTAVAIDGRHERRRQNVEAVVDALYSLWCAGVLQPSAKQIAARSGVSLRSVFRYFDDLDSLVTTAIERHMGDTDHHFQPLAATGTVDERAAVLAKQRVAYQADAESLTQAVRLRAPFHPQLARVLAVRADQLRDQLSVLFAPELAVLGDAERGDRLAALETATGYDAVRFLRRNRGFDGDRAIRCLTGTVRRLLASTA
jgi:AcrR family transcriptional regulator